jgi:hypothetical protein
MKKYKILFLVLIVGANFSFAQYATKPSISFGLGYGDISSNSPSVGALAFHLAASQQLFDLPFDLKVGFTYQRDSEFILPLSGSQKLYFSYLQVFHFGAEFVQELTPYLDFSEHVAYALVNDRVFDGINNWAHGVLLSSELSLLRQLSNFWFTIGMNYGLTFTQNRPNFSDIYFRTNYTFN